MSKPLFRPLLAYRRLSGQLPACILFEQYVLCYRSHLCLGLIQRRLLRRIINVRGIYSYFSVHCQMGNPSFNLIW